MVDILITLLNRLHVLVLECSNIIKDGWTPRNRIKIFIVLKNMRKAADDKDLEDDWRLRKGARLLSDELNEIGKKLVVDTYETGEIFLRKLKSALVFGLETMIEGLKGDTSEYRVLINDLRKVA